MRKGYNFCSSKARFLSNDSDARRCVSANLFIPNHIGNICKFGFLGALDNFCEMSYAETHVVVHFNDVLGPAQHASFDNLHKCCACVCACGGGSLNEQSYL